MISLASFQRETGLSSSAVVEAIGDGLAEATSSDITGKIDWKFFEAALDAPAVKMCAKALHLSFDHEALFLSCSAVTDIRPVFDHDANDEVDPEQMSIAGGVVVHSLRLDFIVDGEKRSLTVSLDNRDIDDLILKLNRAKIKSRKSKELVVEKLQLAGFVAGEETYGF